MEDVLARPRLQPEARFRFPTANVALFLATAGTIILLRGPAFAAALLAILFTHEMGHYVLARYHRVDTTLPYFIPLPLGFGTLGAVIRIRSALPSRRATLDIGAAGPIAGFVVALPLLLWGLAHSPLEVVPALVHGPSSLWEMVAAWRGGEPVFPESSGMFVLGDSLLTLGAEWLVFGAHPGTEVMMHPVGIAAWLGLLVTTLNLVPIGQLDGGHVLYALLGGRAAHAVARGVSLALLLAGVLVSVNWLIWWALTRFVVRLGHPPALVEEPLTPGRRLVAILSLALFVLTFVPVPISS